MSLPFGSASIGPAGNGPAGNGPARNGRADHRYQLASVGVLVVGLAVGIGIVVAQTGSVTGLLDLRIYLGASESWRSGHSLYEFSDPTYGLGSTYPPLWTVIVTAVGWAPVGIVELGWTVTNLLLWLLTLERLDYHVIRTVRSHAPSLSTTDGATTRFGPPVRVLGLLVVWLLSLSTAPVWNTLNQGQVNVLLWFLVTGDLFSHARAGAGPADGSDSPGRWVGWRTGLATALKLVPAIAIVAWALAGRRRVALRAAVVAGVVTAAVAALSPSDSWRYFSTLVFQSDRVGSLTARENNSLAGLMARLGIGRTASLVIAVAVVSGLLWRCRTSLRRCLDDGRIVEVAVVVGLAGALASPISWTHHLVFLCFPLLWVLRVPTWSFARRWLVIVGGVVVLVDPIGFGRSGFTSSARTLVMLAALAAGPSVSAKVGAAVRP